MKPSMRRGKRGSGRRRLRELTRSVVETMEILEQVREKHSGVGGMSKALTQVCEEGTRFGVGRVYPQTNLSSP